MRIFKKIISFAVILTVTAGVYSYNIDSVFAAATLTGTPTAVTWASGADPAGQSITIPSDATAVYMFWTFWRNANGDGLLSATLNSASPNQTIETTTTTAGLTAAGAVVWYNPSTGSQTLDVAWDGAPAEGPTTIVVYVKGGDTSAWRDADTDHNSFTSAVTVTLATVSGDLVIKGDQRFHATTLPGTTAGWSSAQTHSNASENMRVSYISATGATQVCDSEDENYSTVVCISIPAGAAAPVTPTRKLRLFEGFSIRFIDGKIILHQQ